MDSSAVLNFVSNSCYFALAVVALWGIYFVVLVITWVGRKRFKSEEAQDAFLDSIEPDLKRGDFEAVISACEGDTKAVPMMVVFTCKNRIFGFIKVRQLTLDRFQRDVLGAYKVGLAQEQRLLRHSA